MKFGIFYEHQIPRPWDADAEHRIYREALEQVELADRVGIDYAWEVEHHFLEEYSHSSAPEVFLAACSQRTKRIRLGHGIVLMPPAYNHPARVAERIAALDLVSDGRVEFGTGESASILELGGFRLDVADKRAAWQESLEQCLNMMVMTPYPGFEGKYFSMPCRNVVPKPLQKPHPPVWVACSNRETIKRAARLGIGALTFAFVDRPRGGRAARARGTRGSLRRTLAARPALAVAIPLSFAFTQRLSGDGANKKLGPCRGVRPAAANGPAAMTLVGARAEIVAAPFGAHANLQSIRSLNWSGPIDSDHSLDATEFLRRSFGPWTRTQTTRPFFKFSCSNGSTAPRTWRDFTSCRSNRRSSRIWRLCGVGVGSGAWGASGSTCTRPGQSRRSSSRNGSIVRGAADTTSGTDSPASGFRRTARPARASPHGVGNSYRRLTCAIGNTPARPQGSRRTAG